MAVMRSWSWPRGAYQSSRPRIRTSVPSIMRTEPPALVRARFTATLLARRQHHRQARPCRRRAVLDEREVHVPGGGAGQVVDLAPHPHLVAERGPQGVADGVGQLGDREGRLRDHAHRGVVEQRHRRSRYAVTCDSPRRRRLRGGAGLLRHRGVHGRAWVAGTGGSAPSWWRSPPPDRLTPLARIA